MGEETKFHLVRWPKVCSPVFEGGLGVQNLHVFNRALLGKWSWRYTYERKALWRRVVAVKYRSQWDGRCSIEVFGSYGVGLWKFIRRGWEEFSRFSRFKLGDGFKISFWHDFLCEERPFKAVFPELYSISCFRDASMAVHLQFSNGSRQWNINFVRPVQNWKLEFFFSFFNRWYSIKLVQVFKMVLTSFV